MKSSKLPVYPRLLKILLLIAVACRASVVFADRPDWKKEQVNWRLPGGNRAKSIRYPKGKQPPTLARPRDRAKRPIQKTIYLAGTTGPSILANVIESPPIDGFVPWTVVAVTRDRLEELELEAVPTTTISNNHPNDYDPQTDYRLGIFDTGASAHLMGNADAVQSELFSNDLVSENPVFITGVIDSVEALVSQPIGIFVDGLGAIDGGGLFSDTSGVVGMTNTAIIVGKPVTPPTPDLPTAIGTPLAVYYTAVIRNDLQVSVSRNGQQYAGPKVTFHEHYSGAIPDYSIRVPLELRPLGGASVQYVPYINLFDIFGDLFNLDFSTPQTPSVIMGNLSQSVFFVHSVDLTESGNTAIDKDRFMLDTGAQVTVIGSRIGARLALDPDYPDFEVKIQDVTGAADWFPSFYIDSIKIPALGQWLVFENVPVVLLDVASPEGGTLDGIIGMNLLSYYNLVLRGGGLFLQDDPSLELQFIGIPGDIAPGDGDDIVNIPDIAFLAEHWLQTPASPGWNSTCDLAPLADPDGIINFLDFAALAKYWQSAYIP